MDGGRLVPVFMQPSGFRHVLSMRGKAVGHDLIEQTLAHPARRVEFLVVDGQLEGRRLVVVQPPLAAQPVVRVAVQPRFAVKIDDKVIPEKAALLRQSQPDFKKTGSPRGGGHRPADLAVVPPDTQRHGAGVVRPAAQDNVAAGGTRAGGRAIQGIA